MEATFQTEISPKITIFDKLLEKTLLRLIPQNVTPNAVTIFRFISIPFVIYFLYEELYFYGTAFFFISALSDVVDGALARTRNQITEWGTLYDPLADKLLVLSAALIVLFRYTSPLLVFTICAIEASIFIRASYRRLKKGIVVKAHSTGKIKMFFESLSILSLLLFALTASSSFFLIGLYSLYTAIFFGLVSLFVYYSA